MRVVGASVTDQSKEHAAKRTRRETRTNLFAMATIYTNSLSMPVKLRNLSPTGALADGPTLPANGARIRLCRGALQVSGEVVWVQDRRVGLRFDAAVTVTDWLPWGRGIATQQRIDEMVHKARDRSIAPSAAPRYLSNAMPTALELMRLKRALETLATDLADDLQVMERHGAGLQLLDVVAQALRKLAIQD